MKSGPFISCVAAVYRIEDKVVTLLARYLKEAGHLSSGARGINAPDMTPKDIAVITVAAMAAPKSKEALFWFRHFARMQLVEGTDHTLVASRVADPDHTFFDLMVAFCDPEFVLDYDNQFTITFHEKAYVTIDAADGGSLMYLDRKKMKRQLARIDNDPTLAQSEIHDSTLSMHGITNSRSMLSTSLQMLKSIVLSSNFGEIPDGQEIPAVRRHSPVPDNPA